MNQDMSNMKYVVLQERPPKDGTGREANRALVIFDGRISDTVICAGVSRDHQNFSDCNIVEKGDWKPTAYSSAEVQSIQAAGGRALKRVKELEELVAMYQLMFTDLALVMQCRAEQDVMLKRAEYLVQLDSDMQALLEALGGLSDPHHRLDSSINPGPERDALQEVYTEVVSGRPAPLITPSMNWPEELKAKTVEMFEEQYMQAPKPTPPKNFAIYVNGEQVMTPSTAEGVQPGMLELDLHLPCQVSDLWVAIDVGLAAMGYGRIKNERAERRTGWQPLQTRADVTRHLQMHGFALRVQPTAPPRLESSVVDGEHLSTTFHPLDFDKKREI